MEERPKKNIKILSSVAGLALTTLGAIAIFFPNAFNLERKAIVSFSSEISSESDVVKLDDFFSKNVGKVVNININICASLLDVSSKCPKLSIDQYSSSKNKKSELIIDAFDINESDDVLCDKSESFDEGIVIYFDKQEWEWDKFKECTSVDDIGMNVMKGYFLVPDSAGWGQGWSEWSLTSIDEREIKLKDY